MTFEDFIKDAEKIGSIDTPEKLAFYTRQYQSHLLKIEDDNYFEPFEAFASSDFLNQYEKNLNALFKLEEITEGQFYFLVTPSFELENLLVIEKSGEKYILTHTILGKSYWTAFYADHTITDIEKTTLTAVLNSTIGYKLLSLLGKIVDETRKPIAKIATLDGIIYTLSCVLDGRQMTVFKNSPGEDSKSGKAIVLLEQLIEDIENLSDTVLLNIETQIDNLQD